MTDIALDLDPLSPGYKDILIVNGDLVLVDGAQAILQNILQTLGVYLGEWFMDNTIGVDYFGTVLVKNPDQRRIDAIFINQILNVLGVTSLLSYAFKVDTLARTARVTFKCQTTSGIVDYTGTLTA